MGRKPRRCRGQLPIFGYPMTKNYTNARSGDLTYCAYLPTKLSGYYLSFMKGSMAFIQGDDPLPTEPYLRGLVAKYVKGSGGICEEVKSVLGTCSNIAPTRRESKPSF